MVDALAAFAKATVPGPLVTVHALVTGVFAGMPSSVTVPARVPVAGKVTVCAAPASTTGARLIGVGLTAVTVISANDVLSVSSAVSRRT